VGREGEGCLNLERKVHTWDFGAMLMLYRSNRVVDWRAIIGGNILASERWLWRCGNVQRLSVSVDITICNDHSWNTLPYGGCVPTSSGLMSEQVVPHTLTTSATTISLSDHVTVDVFD